MTVLRRTGALVSLRWTGKVPDPDAKFDTFQAALQRRRFRTIESAASEEVSVGWVTHADPTGDTFESEDTIAGRHTWLRVRVDRKKLPGKQVQLHLAVAEKSRGRPLSAKERREVKDGLRDSLLPRILPTTEHIDALMVHDERTLLLLTASKSSREAVAKLFFETFGARIDACGPRELAVSVGDGRFAGAIATINPTRWPSAASRRQRK